MKTKSIVLFKSTSKKERDEQADYFTNKLPQFEIYNNSKQSRSRYIREMIYEVKAKGSVEEIEKYLNEEKNKQNSPVQHLISILQKELKPLREAYIQKTEEWAIRDFKRIDEIASLNYQDYRQRFAKEQLIAGKVRKVLSGQLTDLYHSYKKIKENGMTAFLENQKKLAEDHYENSVIKLAHRIDKKKLNIEKLEVETQFSKIDVNISTLLSDGEKTVRAWTIIACGPIQRPHYRYLIK